jgi:lysophospholipase L1-like esterase
MRIVLIGDSLTHGEGIESPHKWTDIVAASLPRHEVIAKGVCGDTTRLALERFPQDVQELRPDIVVAQFGLNDCNAWASDGGELPRVSHEAFRANLVEMARRARAFGAIGVAFIQMTPSTKDSTQPNWWRFSSGIKAAAEQCGAAFIKHRIPTISTDHLQEDGVHLNEHGNQMVGNAVIDYLAAVIAKSEARAA